MPNSVSPAEITQLLHQWQGGSRDAFDRLVPLVHNELRVLAARRLSREWRHDRLQITAIVNETYLRLFDQREVDWQNRGHFFGIAAQLMRRVLLDHARRQTRKKRGGVVMPVELDASIPTPAHGPDAVDVLDLDRALTRLEALDQTQARIIELRFFGGLTIEETAMALAVSSATVKREWAVAKGWLLRELTGHVDHRAPK
jgi:RNA polymerase sigma factor (TIGR02999 family)